MPQWKIQLVQIAAAAFPLARVSLEALSGGQDVQMTQSSSHAGQAESNAYNVKDHTLRLLDALGRHIAGMNDCATTLRVPVLVLHGGKDYFNSDADVRGFVAHLPPKLSKTYKNYPDAYHLLMYDAENERIFKDVERWLNRLRRGGCERKISGIFAKFCLTRWERRLSFAPRNHLNFTTSWHVFVLSEAPESALAEESTVPVWPRKRAVSVVTSPRWSSAPSPRTSRPSGSGFPRWTSTCG